MYEKSAPNMYGFSIYIAIYRKMKFYKMQRKWL